MAEQRTLDAERAACEAAWTSKSSEINARHRVSWNAPMPEPYRIWFGEGYRAALTTPPALDTEGLPPLIWGDDLEAWLEVRDEAEIVAAIRAAQRHAYDAGQQSQAARIQHLTHERDLALAAARQSAPEGAPVGLSDGALLEIVRKQTNYSAVEKYGDTFLRIARAVADHVAAPTSASAQPADRAPTAQQIEGAVHNLLWLYRRLPRCYGRLPFVEASVRELTKIPSVTLDECFAERGASSAQISAQPPEGVEHVSRNKENSDE